MAGAEYEVADLAKERALNCFIHDIYGQQGILKDGVVPTELVLQSPNYRKECLGVTPKHDAWAHICGTDLVRDENSEFRVLEDNLRVPSGVSYMIENRELTKRVLPGLVRKSHPAGRRLSITTL